jgi:aspartate aminotransferase/aminotransferase
MADNRIADRMAKLDVSGIRKVFDLAADLTDPINLSIGQPHFDVPEPVKTAAVKAIHAGHNKYTQTQGAAELRAVVAESLRREFGQAEPPPVLIASGVSGGLFLASMVLIDPGDEVIIPDPYFVEYIHHVNLFGGTPVLIDTYPDFKLPVDKIADAITDKTRFILLNSPGNPTGAVYSEQELRDLAALAGEHDLLVISDEIYCDFVYDDDYVSFAGLYDNTLLLRGFSKSHAMTGWRMAYATGPANIIGEMTKLQQYTFVCAPSPFQHAAMTALQTPVDDYVADYRAKRDKVYDALGERFGLVKPGGAFYAFVPAPGGDAGAFVAKAIENNVLIIPGAVFSSANTHFRMCYSVDDATLDKGLEILTSLA